MSNIDKQANLRNAARHGRIDDVKRYLNDDTIDVNGKNGSHYDWTALHYACDYGHRDIAELLLDRHGADIDARSSFTIQPLSCGHVMMVMLRPASLSFFWIAGAQSMLLILPLVILHSTKHARKATRNASKKSC